MARYRPFVETVRASLRHAGGLRIDHVMGLFRLFWIPAGMGPPDGAYVRYAADELLAIIALESHRAGVWIAGEDLGTVEPAVRQKLLEKAILSYRLLWFEDDPPARYPAHSLAAVTTHDLPTVAGLWSGADFAAQRRLLLLDDESMHEEIRRRLITHARLPCDADCDEAIVRAYRLLAEAPSAVIAASLDDALAVEERTNMPGTVTEWPNWSLALPKPLEDIEHAALPQRIASSLRDRKAHP
jgi:4-alpha-glucanotransferase